jgi:hypothetical protein
VKNLCTLNCLKKERLDYYKKYLRAQIENSLKWGWREEDIIVFTNFDFEYMGIKSKIEIVSHDFDFCPYIVKWFGIQRMMNETSEVIWFHDLDAWQNDKIGEFEFKDFGFVKVSSGINSGSMFCKSCGLDIVKQIIEKVKIGHIKADEVALNGIRDSIVERITYINTAYNLGCTKFEERLQKAIFPIKVLHFHPEKDGDWDKFLLGKSGVDLSNLRLLEVLYKHFR